MEFYDSGWDWGSDAGNVLRADFGSPWSGDRHIYGRTSNGLRFRVDAYVVTNHPQVGCEAVATVAVG